MNRCITTFHIKGVSTDTDAQIRKLKEENHTVESRSETRRHRERSLAKSGLCKPILTILYRSLKHYNFFAIGSIVMFFDVLKRSESLPFTFRTLSAITPDCSRLGDSNRLTKIGKSEEEKNRNFDFSQYRNFKIYDFSIFRFFIVFLCFVHVHVSIATQSRRNGESLVVEWEQLGEQNVGECLCLAICKLLYFVLVLSQWWNTILFRYFLPLLSWRQQH